MDANDGKLTRLESRSCLCGGSGFVRVCVYTSIRGWQRANPPLSCTSRASQFWIHASSNAVSRLCRHDARSKPLRRSLGRLLSIHFTLSSTTRCIRKDRWSSIIRLRTFIQILGRNSVRGIPILLRGRNHSHRSQGGNRIPESFDGAIRATMEIVDMPDRRASLLVRLILQNNGRLSQTKRATFSELKDEEILCNRRSCGS